MLNLTKILAIVKLIFDLINVFKKDESAPEEKNLVRDSKDDIQTKENIHNETKSTL